MLFGFLRALDLVTREGRGEEPMQPHPLRSPLALARRPPALDRQSIPGRPYTIEGYLAHEHADVIRQLTASCGHSRIVE
ncbi:MAG: hypothetical protein MZW92_81755 [Comamonadaceae bacterium]|nr:hypothetical protein [Comamonadaceae bacterium]